MQYDELTAAQGTFPTAHVRIPIAGALLAQSVDELCLSVRASNCLHRAGIATIGKLADTIEAGKLEVIRNLGRTSSREIKTKLLWAAYDLLDSRGKEEFWQNLRKVE